METEGKLRLADVFVSIHDPRQKGKVEVSVRSTHLFSVIDPARNSHTHVVYLTS